MIDGLCHSFAVLEAFQGSGTVWKLMTSFNDVHEMNLKYDRIRVIQSRVRRKCLTQLR
jgi:hypothetical protein